MYVNFLYREILQHISQNIILVTKNVLLRLAAMYILIEFNCKPIQFHEIQDKMIQAFVPENMLHSFSIGEWRIKLNNFTNRFLQMVKSTELLKVIFVAYLTLNNEYYGCTYYSVSIIQHATLSGKRAYLTLNPYIAAFSSHDHRIVWKINMQNIIDVQVMSIHDTLTLHLYDQTTRKKQRVTIQCRGQESGAIMHRINQMKNIAAKLIKIPDISIPCQNCDKTVQLSQPLQKKYDQIHSTNNLKKQALILELRNKIYQNAWLCIMCQKNIIHADCYSKFKGEDYRVTKKDKQTWICNDCQARGDEKLFEISTLKQYEKLDNIKKLLYARYILNQFFVKI